MANTRVKNHSASDSGTCQRCLTAGTLSSITTATLARIATISHRSKFRSAGLS
jgi:hypothetical protein